MIRSHVRRPAGLRLHRRQAVRSRAADHRRSSTAPRTTTPSGPCKAAPSPTTASTCWRSTCPATAASGGPALASVEAMADWLLAVLDAAGVAQAVLVGHSMGSLIALEAGTRRAPARVRALALLGTTWPMKVSDSLLATARDDEAAAIDMVNIWSHARTAGATGPARRRRVFAAGRVAPPDAAAGRRAIRSSCSTPTSRPATPMPAAATAAAQGAHARCCSCSASAT